MLQGNGWTEKVNVLPKWHEVVQVTHKLMHSPEAVVMPGDATRTNAKVAYDELDGKKSNQAKADQAASDVQKDKGGKKIHWVPIAISGGVAVIGAAMALVFDKKAKDATANPPSNQTEFQTGHDNAQKYQTFRNISLGVVLGGLVGVGLTFLF